MSDHPNPEKQFERLFIAIPINEQIREKVSSISSDLKKGIQFTGAHPSWVKLDNWHFTLFFLGKTEVEKIPEIETALDQVDFDRFSIEIGGLGVFPNPKRPTILWLGLNDNSGKMIELQTKVVENLEKLGYTRDKKRFHPHLTLARIKSLKGVSSLMTVVQSHQKIVAGKMDVSKIILYRSILKPDGAEYTPLYQKKLNVTS